MNPFDDMEEAKEVAMVQLALDSMSTCNAAVLKVKIGDAWVFLVSGDPWRLNDMIENELGLFAPECCFEKYPDINLN